MQPTTQEVALQRAASIAVGLDASLPSLWPVDLGGGEGGEVSTIFALAALPYAQEADSCCPVQCSPVCTLMDVDLDSALF